MLLGPSQCGATWVAPLLGGTSGLLGWPLWVAGWVGETGKIICPQDLQASVTPERPEHPPDPRSMGGLHWCIGVGFFSCFFLLPF